MSDQPDSKSPATAWRQLRKAAEGLLESGLVEDAVAKTKDLATAGSSAAASVLTGAKKAVTQEEAWEQMEEAITALTEVATVQHAMILDLMDRIADLERISRSAEVANK
jgi:hypothetical protein